MRRMGPGWMRKASGRLLLRGVGMVLVLGGSALSAQAEETSPQPSVTPTATSPLLPRTGPKTSKKGKRREQKETEGTEAPERFEADTIIKSVYSLDGQPLEVDPD